MGFPEMPPAALISAISVSVNHTWGWQIPAIGPLKK
jgi:hypothetical protein